MIKNFSGYAIKAVVITFLFTTSCNKINNDRNIVLLLEKEVSRNVGGKIELGKVLNFKWDKLLILSPYTNFSRVEEIHNISLKPIKHSHIDDRDDINQIVFFEGNKIIKMIEFPRSSGDFEDAYKADFFKRDDADFKIFVAKQPKDIRQPRIILKKE